MIKIFAAIVLLAGLAARGAEPSTGKQELNEWITSNYSDLRMLYEHLHSHPELSFMEEKTAERVAGEWRKGGLDVTDHVGGFGVVGLLKNGEGPTVLLRTDLDALPVKEQTGLTYASQAKQKDWAGKEVDVMHACGHDMHMTMMTGTARFLASHKNLWKGTIVFIGQPAEERGGGARKMLEDGLFKRFPKPNYCLALHVSHDIETGKVGYVEGYALANVDSVDITIRGVGGHGAFPQNAKDPIVLAAETILAMQTIVSRELPPTEPAVLTVGSIHGGTKHNIIPEEVKLQLTLRSYSEDVRNHMVSAIRRITKGLGEAAGLPADRLPLVEVNEADFTPATYNDPALTKRWVGQLEGWMGKEKVTEAKAVMGGEDFSEYGRTANKIPICLLWVGAVSAEQKNSGKAPPIHSPFFAPVPESTMRAGINSLVAGVLELTKK